jgi:hypothetical protein
MLQWGDFAVRILVFIEGTIMANRKMDWFFKGRGREASQKMVKPLERRA